MPDYKEMYLEMVRGTERAINILIDTQRKCEEMYLDAQEPEVILMPGADEAKKEKAPG